ncbi:AMED_5909 family protein [Umezawaea sp. NPDC059074]|uniref:AMED_5909 family protein n=1 Tax=Umezawaea sp. NPDC059074 TaxID=3346716 RepID=UPI003673CCAF
MAATVKVDPWAAVRDVRTLREAHEALGKLQPAPSSAPAVLREYYLRSAVIYGQVAETDRGHHHEALYWSAREREKGERISVD